MSRADRAPSVPSQPTLFDFLLIVSGFGLSLILCRAEGLKVTPAPHAPAVAATHLVPILPLLVRLPEGAILLWPVFVVTQLVLGRRQGPTSGEWLWGIAWLSTVLLTSLSAWQTWGTVPEFARGYLAWAFLLGYLIVVPSMAAIALVLILLGLIGRWQPPWTHTFGLALILWPALPVSGILALARIVE